VEGSGTTVSVKPEVKRLASAGSNSPGGAGGVPPPAGAPGLITSGTFAVVMFPPVNWATNF